MIDDIVLAYRGNGKAAARQFPDRPLVLVENLDTLENLAALRTAASLTFAGRWEDLTNHLSSVLINWALAKDGRGCGLYLLDAQPVTPLALSSQIPHRAVDDAIAYVLAGDGIAEAYRSGHRCNLSAERVADIVLDPAEPAPRSLALTGHGAEYCTQFGPHWLSTYQTEFLPGRVVIPAFKLADAVLLNSCASLRLARSSVPEAYSLARHLFGLGTSVLGNTTNTHTSLQFGRLFVEALASGVSLGETVSFLNRLAINMGERPGMQLLGDAAMTCADHGRSRSLSAQLTPIARNNSALKSLQRALTKAAKLEHVAAGFARWAPTPPDFQDRLSVLSQAIDQCGYVVQASSLIDLTLPEVEVVEDSLSRAVDGVEGILALSLTKAVQNHGWLEGLYSRYYRRFDQTQIICSRCGAEATRSQRKPFSALLPPIFRQECSCCGTTDEGFGCDVEFDALDLHREGDILHLELPALPDGARGLVMFHRMPGFEPLEWSGRATRKTVALRALEYAGRVTLVVVMIGSGAVCLRFYTLFVAPLVECADHDNARRL
ncbi:hypothetical protein [Hoeflea poritis]|uniref:CHAT domain-containing protein n=1 Tax=Hoeflea poritis TaxID=2993659 RepID=A0ABT4VMA2_9HYPH|nr:hypothetical protein [Hoeflea poritis]MDA4845242.1 hypothetical protein [Hoeflea poritis]